MPRSRFGPGVQRVRVGQIDRFLRIENQQQPVRQLVYAQHQFARDTPQRFRRALEGFFLDFEDVADFIDKQTERAVGGAYDDVHRQLVVGTLGRVQAAAQIDGNNDL